MNLYSLPTFIISILVILLGLLVLSRNSKNPANRGFFYITLATFIWLFFASFAYNCKEKYLADIYFRICYLGITNIVTTGLFFTLNFLEGCVNRKTKIIIFISGFIWSYAAIFTNLVVSGVSKFYWGYYPRAGIIHPLFLTNFIFFYLRCIIVLLRHLYNENIPKIKRIQIQNIIFAFLIFCLASIDFIGNYDFEIFPLGFIPVSGFLLIIAYSVIKYRFLDVSIAITRTGIFVAVYSFILGIPFVVASTLRPNLIGLFGEGWWWVPMGLLTVLATVGPFIYIYINKKAENALLREQRQYQSTLRQASSGMIRVREIKKLLNLIVHVVTRTVKLEFASIYLFDSDNNQYRMAAKRDSSDLPKYHAIDINSPLVEKLYIFRDPLVYEEVQLQAQDNPHDLKMKSLEQQLREIRAAVVIPSYVGNKMLGFIVLGKKRSGKIFSQDDLNVFLVLANQMALSVENALSYEEIKDTKSQLMQLEKLAMAGKMVYEVAHEIKNPLTAIKTFTEYLDEKYMEAEFRQKFRQVVNAEIDRLQGIVKQLSDVSRINKPRFIDKVNAHQVIEAVVFLLEKELSHQNIILTCSFYAESAMLRADPDQLKQCFLNLILNASEALQDKLDGEKRIIISTYNPSQKFPVSSARGESAFGGSLSDECILFSAREGASDFIPKGSTQAEGKLMIEVTDNANGISAENLPRIFEPFYTAKEKGTGLGLSIVQGIILNHNGKISCQSQVGKGTTFVVELPLV